MNLQLKGDIVTEIQKVLDASIEMVLLHFPASLDKHLWEQLVRVVKPHGVIITVSYNPMTSSLAEMRHGLFKHAWAYNYAEPYQYVTTYSKTKPTYNQQNPENNCPYPFETPKFTRYDELFQYMVSTHTHVEDVVLVIHDEARSIVPSYRSYIDVRPN